MSLVLRGFAGLFLLLVLSCAKDGEDGVNGADGKDGASLNADSLSKVLRADITDRMWDSLQAADFLDSVYSALYSDAFSQSWIDSTRLALRDSMETQLFDSLYLTLYDSIYNDIFTQSVQRYVAANIFSIKKDYNTAFANQYATMYKGYQIGNIVTPVPVAVYLQNLGTAWYKVVVKSWIEGYTDTGSVSVLLYSGTSDTAGPALSFKPSAYVGLAAPQQAQLQIRAYALSNNKEILVLSESQTVNIHPPQIFGAEYAGIDYAPWRSVFVTPNMDSITTLLHDISAKLPGGNVVGYQAYTGKTIAQSVNLQVQAIYEVLQERSLKYINNPEAGSPGQKIKYPIEVLRTKQANCIESTTLFASILEAISLEPVIVEIPGHAFLGWKTEEGGSTYSFLETTMVLGTTAATYDEAATQGTTTYNNEVTAGNFSNGSSRIVSVLAARANGILPNDMP